MDKQQLRQMVRERKRAMTQLQLQDKSEALTRRFLAMEQYARAKAIYGYLPFNQEVRTEPLLRRALLDGKRVALPKVVGGEMRFVWMEDLSRVTRSPLGCPEPIQDGPAADDPHALVLLPGVAFDRAGGRLGYGGGYYDRFLSREPEHPTVALCFDFQMFDKLPTEIHDIPAELVLWA